MKLFKDLTAEAKAAWFTAHNEPAFRQKQIDEWLYKRWVMSFAEMTNLPKGLREALEADFLAFALVPAGMRQASDGTKKYLFQLGDCETIEGVLIPSPRRDTVCISTQVGCPVRCAFCASGAGGLVRNLTASEIVDQVIFSCRELKERVNNIVVMGMGEPLLNLDNLLTALDTICDPDKLGFGQRHITVSTSGIVPGIRKLAESERQWNLALSLHASTDETRAKLIPKENRYPLVDILDACRESREMAGRMVTFEYALIRGMNDTHAEIAGLARLARDCRAKVNIIPYNSTGRGKFSAPDRAGVQRIVDELVKQGIQVAVRKEMGADIQAACGQLRRQTMGLPPESVENEE